MSPDTMTVCLHLRRLRVLEVEADENERCVTRSQKATKVTEAQGEASANCLTKVDRRRVDETRKL